MDGRLDLGRHRYDAKQRLERVEMLVQRRIGGERVLERAVLVGTGLAIEHGMHQFFLLWGRFHISS